MAGGIFLGAVPVTKVILGAVAPVVTNTMAPANVITGAVLTFTATVVGGAVPIAYAWQYSANGVDGWVPVDGEVAATYARTTVAADNTGAVRCVVTDAQDQSDWGAPLIMVVALPAAPTVTITMTPASVIEGAVLNFAATGVGAGTLTYQWNLAGVAIAGATLVTYARTTVLADNAGVITCTVTDVHAQTGVSAGQTMVVAAFVPLPGFNWPSPQSQAQADLHVEYGGSAIPVVNTPTYFFANSGAAGSGWSIKVDVSPGVAYRFQLHGSSLQQSPNRRLLAGTTVGGREIFEGATILPADFYLGTHYIDFTPTTSVIYVSLHIDAVVIVYSSWQDVLCVPV